MINPRLDILEEVIILNNNNIEIIYNNIDKMTDKNFYEYLKTIPKELTEEFSEDLFYNKGLTRFLDVKKKMRSMKVVYRLCA